MKRTIIYGALLTVFLLSCLLCGLFQTPVFAAESSTTQGNITYVIDKDAQTAKVTKGKPANSKIVIPDKIEYEGKSYPVTSVGSKAFSMTSYQELIIGANVEKIEKLAFGDSFDEVCKIQFNGSKCQSIASDAFDWMTFSRNFQLVVNGSDGCMDQVLNGVVDLKKYVNSITYMDTAGAEASTRDLQEKINAVPDNQETVISIGQNISLSQTIIIPSEKQIILRDDGKPQEIKALNTGNVQEMFHVQKGAKLTFDETPSGSLSFIGAASGGSEQGNIVNVSGSFYLKSGSLKGGKESYITGNASGAVCLAAGAYFKMSGGTITDFSFKHGNGSPLMAPVVVPSGAEFVMTGGVIKNNNNDDSESDRRQPKAGGVILYTWGEKDPAKMTMKGTAEIKSNEGGGVQLVNNTDFVMEGGSITDNKNNTHGGGVCVAGSQGNMKGEQATKFTMKGGTIAQNHTAACGGGIYVNSSDVTLEGGHIQDNTAERQGGGIYVSTTPYTLHMYNALITENTAAEQGGGIWLCPTGTAKMYITNGGAIFNNKASSENGSPSAGDDFVFVGGSKNDESVILAERMLGGGRISYYRDGSVYNTKSPVPYLETGAVDPNVPRFDPDNPGKRVTDIDPSRGYALKGIASSEAKNLAKSVGKLYVTGNKAQKGGGIGSNGSIIIGKENKEYTLQINKTWSSNTPEKNKKEITVYLKVGEVLLDRVTLNSDNKWTAKLSGLPSPDSLKDLEYAIIENPVPKGFKPEYSKALINEEDKTITLSIENIYSPHDERVTKTGDNTRIGLWIGLLLISFSIIMIFGIMHLRKIRH